MPFFSWETAYALGAVLIFLGLIWGVMASRTRNRRNDAVSQEATRAQYEHPDTYQSELRPKLEKKLPDKQPHA
jgi:hypothetical protein